MKKIIQLLNTQLLNLLLRLIVSQQSKHVIRQNIRIGVGTIFFHINIATIPKYSTAEQSTSCGRGKEGTYISSNRLIIHFFKSAASSSSNSIFTPLFFPHLFTMGVARRSGFAPFLPSLLRVWQAKGSSLLCSTLLPPVVVCFCQSA